MYLISPLSSLLKTSSRQFRVIFIGPTEACTSGSTWWPVTPDRSHKWQQPCPLNNLCLSHYKSLSPQT